MKLYYPCCGTDWEFAFSFLEKNIFDEVIFNDMAEAMPYTVVYCGNKENPYSLFQEKYPSVKHSYYEGVDCWDCYIDLVSKGKLIPAETAILFKSALGRPGFGTPWGILEGIDRSENNSYNTIGFLRLPQEKIPFMVLVDTFDQYWWKEAGGIYSHDERRRVYERYRKLQQFDSIRWQDFKLDCYTKDNYDRKDIGIQHR